MRFLKLLACAYLGIMVGLLTFQIIRIDEGMSVGAYLGGSSWGLIFMLLVALVVELKND